MRTQGILVATLLAALAGSAAAQDTPAERFRRLASEYQTASGGEAKNDEERLRLIGRVFQRRNEIAQQLVELAESHPDDPVAVDALLQAAWQVNSVPWPVEIAGQAPAARKALELLARDHIGSEKLGSACPRVATGFGREHEAFLRAVLERSPREETRAAACLGLARFLDGRLQRLDLVREEPKLGKEFAGLYGADYLEALMAEDRARVTAEIEAILDRAAEAYGALKMPGGTTVAEAVEAQRFELRHLQVGCEAPDIEGTDQDGVRFRLRDYRGKVVLLDFWHEQ